MDHRLHATVSMAEFGNRHCESHIIRVDWKESTARNDE